MKLEVIVSSPQRVLFKGEAGSVKLPGEAGVFEVCTFHKPLLSRLITGNIYVDDAVYPLKRGVVKVLNNKVIVLIEEA
jgi:F-type H+-transporting ATPase subunit epsilon